MPTPPTTPQPDPPNLARRLAVVRALLALADRIARGRRTERPEPPPPAA